MASKKLLDYKVIAEEDYSYAGMPRKGYRVLLEVVNLPEKEDMERVAKKLWENGNKDWGEFTVFMYLPKMDIRNVAFYVAEFRPHGLVESRVQDYALYKTNWKKEK